MPTYIGLIRWTEQGIRNIKEVPNRIEAAKQAAKANGAEFRATYMVMGRYDIVTIVEAPNDEIAAKLALSAGCLGDVHSETLRAFTEEETKKIIAGLPGPLGGRGAHRH